jgi:aromatic ring hydroxylase
MAARTGEQFLRGLAGRRDLWVGGDKVSSVVDHPALSGAPGRWPRSSTFSIGRPMPA